MVAAVHLGARRHAELGAVAAHPLAHSGLSGACAHPAHPPPARPVHPPRLVARTVYPAVAVTALGTPEMMPVVLSRLSPAGSTGTTVYRSTGPPLCEGVLGWIGAPTV